MLELCGVPSLAFAVGVYLPLSSSTPIFVGGLVRYVADKWGTATTPATAEAGSETESETSSGSLLSTGYIAGGAIAGVLIAFLSFSERSRILTVWQYRPSPSPKRSRWTTRPTPSRGRSWPESRRTDGSAEGGSGRSRRRCAGPQ